MRVKEKNGGNKRLNFKGENAHEARTRLATLKLPHTDRSYMTTQWNKKHAVSVIEAAQSIIHHPPLIMRITNINPNKLYIQLYLTVFYFFIESYLLTVLTDYDNILFAFIERKANTSIELKIKNFKYVSQYFA